MANEDKNETEETAEKPAKKASTRAKSAGSKSKSKSSKSETTKPKPKARSRSKKKDEPKEEAEQAVEAAEEKPAPKKKSRSRKPKADKAEEAPKKEAKKEAKKDDKPKKEAKKDDKPEKPKRKKWRPADRLKAGTKWLDTLFEKMQLENIEVEAKVGEKQLEYNVHGGDAAQLLGAGKASAKALESIQTILREALVNGFDTDYDVHLDVDSFRLRRTEHLEDVARGLAETAASIGTPITVAGFNSFERRVVHQTLSEDKTVTTDSEGRGSFRKLRVEPR